MSKESNFLSVGLNAARRAGRLVKHYYGMNLDVGYKRSKEDFVTVADSDTENMIKNSIKESFPNHVILGEETHITVGNSSYVWVIDPIDGTSNFVNKIPYFSISIGLLKGVNPILGIVYNPVNDELYHAFNGESFLNNERIKTNNISKLNDAIIYVSQNHDQPYREALPRITSLINAKKVIEKKSTALALAHTALGQASAYLKLSIKNWDVIAGHYIAECAGCKVTDNYGNKLSYDYTIIRNYNGILAANPKLHKQILKFLLQNREKALTQQ